MLPHSPRYAVRARYVLPIERPPLAEGVVVVDGQHIRDVTTTPPRDCELIDLGHVALLPGLVNAHVHLDFSDCDAPLGRLGMAFSEWLDLAIARRRGEAAADSCNRMSQAVAKGLRECVNRGTTTLANIHSHQSVSLPENFTIDCLNLLEIIGLSLPRAHAEKARLNNWLALAKLGSAAEDRGACWGISPHAPYSVRRELLDAAIEVSRRSRVLVAMHLAESSDELELLEHQRGPLVDLLARWDAWDASALTPGQRPHHYLEVLAQAPRALVVHGNYLDASDWTFLAARADRMAVVHCPRTHHYFRHPHFPLAKLLAAGVNVALGTDGRGSNPDLSLWEEMRQAASVHSDVLPGEILRLGTLGGAQALGVADHTGSLVPGKLANLVAIDLPQRAVGDPGEGLLHDDSKVAATIHRGRFIYFLRHGVVR